MDRKGLSGREPRSVEGPRSRLSEALAELRGRPTDARADRALARQLEYQRRKAQVLLASRERVERELADRTIALRARIARRAPLAERPRVLEVGSGAHGHVFFLGERDAIGVDPLAEAYRALFPWQARVRTIVADGACLPLPSESFDLVISDNVIDHARDPAGIVAELARVLAPGGVLYLTVHVHHRLYGAVSRVHGALRAIGIPIAIGPFDDHTVHLSEKEARRIFAARRELEVVSSSIVRRDRSEHRSAPIRALVATLPKNMLWEVIARRR